MKKKSTFITYIKRTLLILLCVVVLIVVGVYFLDAYKAASVDFDNKYEDSYWENLEENGFVGYETLVADTNALLDKVNYAKTATYVAPYAASATALQKLQSARYKEELEKIYNSLTDHSDQAVEDYYTAKLAEFAEYTWVDFKEDYSFQEVLNNGNYRLLFNSVNTEFILEQLDANGEVLNAWRSNPKVDTRDTAMYNQQSSLLNVTFVNGDKTATISPVTYNTYAHSITEDQNKQVIPNYYVNIIKDTNGKAKSLQVYYVFEERGIDYTWFPKTITSDRLKELIDRCNTLVDEYKQANNGAYKKDSKNVEISGLGYGSAINKYPLANRNLYSFVVNQTYTIDQTASTASQTVYTIRGYENLTGNQLNFLYRFFYEWCGYTFEDLEVDTGVEKVSGVNPKIELAVEYSLNENGLGVLVPGNSVKTNQNAKGDYYEVTSIDVLPYFTSVAKAEEADGYAVIPDGSGSILEFDNNKANYTSYSKRIYSSDVTFTSYTLTTSTTDILLPMYAYVFTGDANHNPKAMVVEALDGAAQVTLNADTSNRGRNSYNWAYYSIAFRESQRIVIGTSSFNRNATTQYTTNAATCDYSFSYMCLDTAKYDANYTGVAKFYRDILIERSKDEQGVAKLSTANDTTDNVVLDLDILGAYSYATNFLGIGYTGNDSVTTVDQLQTMLNEILNLEGLNNKANVNVYYHGWRKEGLKDVSFENIKVSNKIGGKKALLDAINNAKENVTIYPYVEFVEYQGYQESFGQGHYTARDVGGSYSIKYPYELNSNVFNEELDKIMALSPAYYTAFASTLAKKYQKVLGVENIAINGLGSTLSGNYRKNKEMFKVNAVLEQIESFEILKDSGVDKFALKAPYAYALEYTATAYDVPYQSTQYEILDYTVPFYQLVVSGLFDYSSESINENVEKGTQEHIMRCIETGSNLSFTFTYDDSAELIQTNYNNYYYTYYSRWLEDVEETYKELNNLGIYDCELTSHERLDNNVYRVTYSNSTGKEIKIILNYQRTTWTMPGTNVKVPAKDYAVE